MDIAYFLNREIEKDARTEESQSQLNDVAVINTAIEESRLGARVCCTGCGTGCGCGGLYEQD